MKTDYIKKLHLKKGHKYILIIPVKAGLSHADMEDIDSKFVELSIMVKTTEGLKVVEIEE